MKRLILAVIIGMFLTASITPAFGAEPSKDIPKTQTKPDKDKVNKPDNDKSVKPDKEKPQKGDDWKTKGSPKERSDGGGATGN